MWATSKPVSTEIMFMTTYCATCVQWASLNLFSTFVSVLFSVLATFSLLVFCCFVAQLLSESSCSVNEDTKMLYEKLEFTFNKMFSLKLRTYNLLMRLTYMDKSDRGKKDAIIFNWCPAVSWCQTDLAQLISQLFIVVSLGVWRSNGFIVSQIPRSTDILTLTLTHHPPLPVRNPFPGMWVRP